MTLHRCALVAVLAVLAVLAVVAAAVPAALASPVTRVRSDAAVLDSQADHVIDALYTLGCTAEADRVGNAADATHQIQTCRVTTRDPSDWPMFPTDPAPADWVPDVTIIRRVVTRLGRQPWPPAETSAVRALRRAATLLAVELSAPASSAPAGAAGAGSRGGVDGRPDWSTTVFRQIRRVRSLAAAVVAGPASRPRR